MDQNLSNTAQTELPFDETAVAVGHKNGSDEPSYIRCTVIEPVMKCMCLNKARATESIYMMDLESIKRKALLSERCITDDYKLSHRMKLNKHSRTQD